MAVLHLEDDGPLRDIFRLFFTKSAPDIGLHQFISSDDAVEFIKDHIADIRVFVLDIRVPGQLDGIGVAQKIRELGSDRPIVIMSAFRQPTSDILKSFNGVWIPKPSHILNMVQTIIPMATNDATPESEG